MLPTWGNKMRKASQEMFPVATSCTANRTDDLTRMRVVPSVISTGQSHAVKVLSRNSSAAARGRSQSIADRSVKPPTEPTYSDRLQRHGRPVSPHVTIYRQAIPAISSITNRVSGVALSLGFGGVSVIAAAGGDVPSVITTAMHAMPSVTPLAKFVVASPLVYHWMGGCRHQFWSTYPQYITLEFGQRSSMVILSSALILSGIASVVTLSPPKPTK